MTNSSQTVTGTLNTREMPAARQPVVQWLMTQATPGAAPSRPPVAHQPEPPIDRPTLTVLLPVMNERDTLPAVLQRVLAVPIETEVLIVDDASTDGTRQVLEREIDGRFPGVRVFYHQTNQGKGAAIRTAIPHATGEFCIVQDGDLEYDPKDYAAIVEALRRPGTDAVYGSRFLRGAPPMRLPNLVVNRLLAAMVRILYGARLTDEATCYKAFRTSLLQSIPLQCRRFEFCPEVTARVLRRGYSIAEVPIRYEARSMEEGKKIRWTDGVTAIWTLVRWRFGRA